MTSCPDQLGAIMSERFTELLPWYVNGRINADDRAWVDEHLRANPQAAAELRWYESLQRRVQENAPNVSDEIGMDRALAKIQHDLQGEKRIAAARRAQTPTAMERVRNWLGSFGLTPALTAAVAVIALQGGLIFKLMQPADDEITGIRASRGVLVTAQPLLKVNFAADAKEADIRMLLLEVRGDLVRGPGQLGDYFVNVPQGQLAVAAARMKADKIVEAVAEVPGLPAKE